MGMIKSLSVRSTFAALAAVSFLGGCASLGQPDPVDPRFKDLQEHMAAQSAARCKAEFDGSSWRGEFTNKDLINLMGSGGLTTAYPGVEDAAVYQSYVTAAGMNVVYCVDNQLRGLKTADGSPVTASIQLFGKPDADGIPTEQYLVIGINPVAPDAKNARASQKMAMVDAAKYLPGLAQAYSELSMMKRMMGGVPKGAPEPEHIIFKPVGISLDLKDLDKEGASFNDPNVVKQVTQSPANPLKMQ
jgi:hypothetical protein